METHAPSLGDKIAHLRRTAQAQEKCAWIPSAIHALIMAALARIFGRLENIFQLWQAGTLPAPPVRRSVAPARTGTARPISRRPISRRSASRACRRAPAIHSCSTLPAALHPDPAIPIPATRPGNKRRRSRPPRPPPTKTGFGSRAQPRLICYDIKIISLPLERRPRRAPPQPLRHARILRQIQLRRKRPQDARRPRLRHAIDRDDGHSCLTSADLPILHPSAQRVYRRPTGIRQSIATAATSPIAPSAVCAGTNSSNGATRVGISACATWLGNAIRPISVA